jgi:hypothetical protein
MPPPSGKLAASMKKKTALSVVVMLMLLLGYGLGYWTGFSHARKGPRVIVAIDTADSQRSTGKAEYEQFSTKQNPIPNRVK